MVLGPGAKITPLAVEDFVDALQQLMLPLFAARASSRLIKTVLGDLEDFNFACF